MKKILTVILSAVLVSMLVGCETEDKGISKSFWEDKIERENSLREETNSREAEIKEVDEWGVSLDDVDRLTKQAIRKHDMTVDYKLDYNKVVREIDEFLEDVESGKAVEYSLEYLLNKYNTACETGIDYIESWVDVKLTYDLYLTDGKLDKLEKEVLRSCITLNYSRIQNITQSQTDMGDFLQPIIDENRKLTDEEIGVIYDIYQVLIDNVYSTNH